jgi:hypothetical protein
VCLPIDVELYLNRDWKESGGLDRNSAFMVRLRVSPNQEEICAGTSFWSA